MPQHLLPPRGIPVFEERFVGMRQPTTVDTGHGVGEISGCLREAAWMLGGVSRRSTKATVLRYSTP